MWQTKKHSVQTLEAFIKHEFNRVVSSLTTRKLNVHVVPYNRTPLKYIDPTLYKCCNVIVHDYTDVQLALWGNERNGWPTAVTVHWNFWGGNWQGPHQNVSNCVCMLIIICLWMCLFCCHVTHSSVKSRVEGSLAHNSDFLRLNCKWLYLTPQSCLLVIIIYITGSDLSYTLYVHD